MGLQNQGSNVSGQAKDEHEATTSNNIEGAPSIINGSNVCDLCGKMFQFRYQLIVHRLVLFKIMFSYLYSIIQGESL